MARWFGYYVAVTTLDPVPVDLRCPVRLLVVTPRVLPVPSSLVTVGYPPHVYPHALIVILPDHARRLHHHWRRTPPPPRLTTCQTYYQVNWVTARARGSALHRATLPTARCLRWVACYPCSGTTPLRTCPAVAAHRRAGTQHTMPQTTTIYHTTTFATTAAWWRCCFDRLQRVAGCRWRFGAIPLPALPCSG